jgi:hypothetical protein
MRALRTGCERFQSIAQCEIRCYIRDPDGYIIEVGQSTDLTDG